MTSHCKKTLKKKFKLVLHSDFHIYKTDALVLYSYETLKILAQAFEILAHRDPCLIKSK